MDKKQVTIIDYGVGNLLSVQRGLEFCGAKVTITSNVQTILNSERIVLPGVGAFPNAMSALNNLGLVSVIQKFADLRKPLLAICLGMQLLMDESEEFNLTSGLGLIPGRVVPVPNFTIDGKCQKIPHIGWSGLYPPGIDEVWGKTLLQDVKVGEATYFVHSYMVEPTDSKNIVAEATYGGHQVPAVIKRGQITGCQFHPEKSGEVGLKILRQFIRL